MSGAAFVVALRAVHSIVPDVLTTPRSVSVSVIACTAYLASSLIWPALPRPYVNRQVPAVWRQSLGPGRASFLYAAILAVGVLTRIRTTGYYVALVLAVLGSLTVSAIPVLLYSSTRLVAIVVVSRVVAGDYWAEPERALDRVATLGRRLVPLEAAVLVGIGLLALSTLSTASAL